MINETFIINHRRDKDLGALISSFMGLYHACQLCSFPREGNGYPLQYSGLENSMDCIVHGRRRQWHPTPVLLPGKSHGWRSLVACSPWGRDESDATERLHFHFHFHTLEKAMATHSSVLAWRIPRMGEPGGLPSMGPHRVRFDWSDLAAMSSYIWVKKKKIPQTYSYSTYTKNIDTIASLYLITALNTHTPRKQMKRINYYVQMI